MAVALDRGHLRSEHEPHALFMQPAGDSGGHLRAEPGRVGRLLVRDERHLGAAATQGGRDLAADEAGADHDHLAAGDRQALQQLANVVKRADDSHPWVVGPGDRQPSGLRPGGEHAATIGECAGA